jgi:hypothetical protein
MADKVAHGDRPWGASGGALAGLRLVRVTGPTLITLMLVPVVT